MRTGVTTHMIRKPLQNQESGSTETAVRLKITSTGLFFLGILLQTSAVLAESSSGHGGNASAAHHGPSMSLLWLNFAIYSVVMYRLLRKPISGMWHGRRQRIADAVERGFTMLSEAQSIHEKLVEEEANLESKLETIREELISGAEEECKETVESARERANRLLNQARQLAEAERNRRVEAIRRDFARLVIARAEEIVENQLTAETDVHIRRAALENESGLNLLAR
jgi:F0F1-type ATP synthase membrane subunit b/b'